MRGRRLTILVVGASGATGRLLVEQLLERGEQVRAIVRSPQRLPDSLRNHANMSVTSASVLKLSESELRTHVDGCEAVASCLGHNLNFKGIFGHPRRLVTEAAKKLCDAILSNGPQHPVKFVLMNTTGNSNRDLSEPVSAAQKCVIWLLRHLVPPHADNEQAADYLRTGIDKDDETIEWSAVRPDKLIDADEVTQYTVHPSPIRSAIFDAGKTSRINVGHFMADLITDSEVWDRWKGKMPVIYNDE